MDKKSLVYSAVLLLGLVFVSVLLNKGIIQGVHSNSHVKLTTNQSLYPEGGEITFTGEIEFALNERVDIKEVRLKNLTGPTPLDVGLPVEPTGTPFVTFVPIPVASGTLLVNVALAGITGGSSTGTTIPGTNHLTSGSDGLKGVTATSKIIYTVKWTPPNTSAAIGNYSAKLFVALKNGTKLESSAAAYGIVTGRVVSIVGPSDVSEASSTATYTVTVSPTSTESVIFGYKTVNGTAIGAQDFTSASTTAIVGTGGDAATTITVAITNDTLDESNESFSVVLTSAVGGSFDPRAVQTRIIDNDAAVTVTLASSTASIVEGDSGTATISVPVTLSAAAGRDVTLSYATSDGTASSSSDYVAASGTLTIAAGDTSAQISVVINGDTDAETNETFSINISNAFAPKTATDTIAIIASTTVVTITDDDTVTTVTVDVPISLGFNLVGIPVDVGTTTKYADIAAQFAAQGGVVTQILAWTGSSQAFDPWSASQPANNNDPVVTGQGYFIQVTTVPTSGFWQVTGAPINSSVALNLVNGFNLISIPSSTSNYTYSTLSDAISSAGGVVTQILAWTASSQAFDPWSASQPANNNDPVDTTGKAGYFIQTTTGVTNFNP